MKHPPAKLVLDPRSDGALLAALGPFPLRAQSQVLASWLQDGYRLMCGQRPSALFVPAGPVPPRSHRPAVGAVRRVHYRDASLPGLALLLGSLNRRERGQEIRRLICLALRQAWALPVRPDLPAMPVPPGWRAALPPVFPGP